MIPFEFEGGRHSLLLRPRGAGRYFVAGFLAVWLCGWVAGEVFALWALAAALGSLLAPGGPVAFPASSGSPQGAGAVAVMAFLCVWLLFWTIGGVAALRELSHLLIGADRVRFDAMGVERVRTIGPLRIVRRWSRDEILAVSTRRPRGLVRLRTRRRDEPLTAFGTDAERAELARRLRETLGLDARRSRGADRPASLPDGWEATPLDDGSHWLAGSARTRAAQARTCWGVLTAVAVLAALLVSRAGSSGELAAGPRSALTGLAVVGALMAVAGAWLSYGRSGWVVRRGSMTFRRSFGGHAREEVMSHPILHLEHRRDSDGDDLFRLVARAEGRRRTVAAASRDAEDLLRLGSWLAGRTSSRLDVDRGAEPDAAAA